MHLTREWVAKTALSLANSETKAFYGTDKALLAAASKAYEKLHTSFPVRSMSVLLDLSEKMVADDMYAAEKTGFTDFVEVWYHSRSGTPFVKYHPSGDRKVYLDLALSLPRSRRAALLAVTEHPSQEAMEKYLRDHPKADKSQHVVERDGGGAEDKDPPNWRNRSEGDGEKRPPMRRKPTQRRETGKAKADRRKKMLQEMKKKQLDKMKTKRQERESQRPRYKGPRKAAACAEGTCSHCTCQQAKLVVDWGLEEASRLTAAYYRRASSDVDGFADKVLRGVSELSSRPDDRDFDGDEIILRWSVGGQPIYATIREDRGRVVALVNGDVYRDPRKAARALDGWSEDLG